MGTGASTGMKKNCIRALRQAYGETQQAFSNRIGIAISSQANYEAGKRYPDAVALLKFYDAALEIDRADLADKFKASLREVAGPAADRLRK